MRISDWSSDVCSSDLAARRVGIVRRDRIANRGMVGDAGGAALDPVGEADRGAQRGAHHVAELRVKGIVRRAQDGDVKGDVGLERIILAALGGRHTRSEEHTSELQSLMRISYAVFCLKKKKQAHNTQIQ